MNVSLYYQIHLSYISLKCEVILGMNTNVSHNVHNYEHCVITQLKLELQQQHIFQAPVDHHRRKCRLLVFSLHQKIRLVEDIPILVY